MKHKCQSRLVRCALRGQHPRPVVYLFDGRMWVITAPLKEGIYDAVPRDKYPEPGDVLARERRLRAAAARVAAAQAAAKEVAHVHDA